MMFPLGDLFTGKLLARFRAWLDRHPNKPPSAITPAQAFGRTLLAIVAAALVLIPFVWLVFFRG